MILDYLLKVLLFSGAFYFVYIGFLRRLSFHKINRYVLLAIPVVCLLVPWLAAQFQRPEIFAGTMELMSIDITATPIEDFTSGTSSLPLFKILYLLGFSLLIISTLIGVFRVRKIISSSESESINDTVIRFSNQLKNPFTFFRIIVIPEELRQKDTLNTIVKHESVHARQFHSIDNLFYNILSALLWFNPFIHLLSREIRQVHECIADEEALKITSREAYASLLLSSAFGSEVILPSNPFFNSSLIKTRINMIYKRKSSKWLRLSYLIMIPTLAMLSLYACNKVDSQGDNPPRKIVEFAEVDRPPLFNNCDESASMEEQQICFQMGIQKFMIENLKYPQDAYEMGIIGKVFVGFIITEDGNIANVEVIRANMSLKGAAENEPITLSDEQKAAASGLENNAVTLMKAFPKMKPAQKDGDAVAIKFVLPVNYTF